MPHAETMARVRHLFWLYFYLKMVILNQGMKFLLKTERMFEKWIKPWMP